MDTNTHLGDGLVDAAKNEINNRNEKLIKLFIDTVYDYFEDAMPEAIKNFPEAIKNLRSQPETEEKIAVLWSERLFKEGLIPQTCVGLEDDYLVANLHQEGYMSGLFVGYVLAMMALVDNNAPEEIILATRDSIRPNLYGHHYDERDDFINRYKDDKYRWIEKI